MSYKVKNGWRAQAFVSGMKPKTKIFHTKRLADDWEATKRSEMLAQKSLPEEQKHTVADAFNKYAAEVSPTKRGKRWELLRIAAFLRDPLLLPHEKIGSLSTAHLTHWRNERSKVVKDGTVLREISLLADVLEYARRDWKWITVNAMSDVRKPKKPPHRDIIYTKSEIKRLLQSMKYSPLKPIIYDCQSVAVTFLVALRTGMRSKEICSIKKEHLMQNYVVLPETKTTPRFVPLDKKVLRLLSKVARRNDETLFGITSKGRDVLFRRYKKKAGIERNLTYHDSRHYAATMMVRFYKVDILTLCKMFGWKDPKHAMIYYNPTPQQMLEKLKRQ